MALALPPGVCSSLIKGLFGALAQVVSCRSFGALCTALRFGSPGSITLCKAAFSSFTDVAMLRPMPSKCKLGRGKALAMTGRPWGEHPLEPREVCFCPTWLSDCHSWATFSVFANSASCSGSCRVPGRLCLLVWSLLSDTGLASISSAMSVFPWVRNPYRDSSTCQYFQTAGGDAHSTTTVPRVPWARRARGHFWPHHCPQSPPGLFLSPWREHRGPLLQ